MVAFMTDWHSYWHDHLLLGQPNEMMHYPACKLFWHRFAETWLHALSWYHSPEVQVDYSRCVQPELIFAQAAAEALSHWISPSSELHQTEWANVLFHDLHRENKSLRFSLLESALTSCGSVGAVWAERSASTNACECLVRTLGALRFGMYIFWLTSHFTFCSWISWLSYRLCKVSDKHARNIGSWKRFYWPK